MDKIYIPTVNRVHQQTTYNALPPSLQQHVTFVVQAWERDQYPYDADYLVLPEDITLEHPHAISETRRIIYETAQHTKYAMLDDDLVFLRRNAKYWTGIPDMEKSSQPCSPQDILEMFQLFSRWLDEEDCTVCGCSQVQNIPARTLFRKHTSLTSGLWINGPNFAHELPTMNVTATRVAEDVAFLLTLLSRGYGNRVSTKFSMRNSSLTSSNHSDIWDATTTASVQRDHETLEQMFPGIFVILRNPDGSRVQGGFRNFGKTRISWNKAYKQFFRPVPR